MLYLVDSSIYIFRAWQTLPDSIQNTHGEPANAVMGFADTVAKIISEEQPTHMVCAFDQSLGKGARKAIYPAYKANRPPAPPDLAVQFQRCFEEQKLLVFRLLEVKQWRRMTLSAALQTLHKSVKSRSLSLALIRTWLSLFARETPTGTSPKN